METRVLWLLRAAVVRAKSGFSGFVQMFADLHGVPSDRENDVYCIVSSITGFCSKSFRCFGHMPQPSRKRRIGHWIPNMLLGCNVMTFLF